MKTTPIFSAFVALTLLASASAFGVIIGPTATATVDGQVISLAFREGTKGWELVPATYQAEGGSVEIKNGSLNPDPSLAYGIAVTDFGAPSNFSFTFFTPIVSTGPCVDVLASISGGLLDFTDDGVSINPVGPRTTLQTGELFFPLTDAGVPVGPGVSHASDGIPGAEAYGVYEIGPQAGPAGTWTAMQLNLQFGLSGGSDTAALTGFFSVEEGRCAVPEGGSAIALLGIALGSLEWLRRKVRA